MGQYDAFCYWKGEFLLVIGHPAEPERYRDLEEQTN